ncbi:MAG: type II secretion system F family protein [Firmicutes bacterium]|nr:type II secretion system F family protein [Bacillota bacterium]
MPWYLNILVFCFVFLVVLILYEFFVSPRKKIEERLEEIKKINGVDYEEEDELEEPFYQRVFLPFYRNIGQALSRLTPQGIKLSLERKIVYAGSPWNINFNSLIALQCLLAAVLALCAFAFSWMLQMEKGMAVLLVILGAFVGGAIPVSLINARAAKRQKDIQKALPDVLDLLLVSVEAGLGFDMALKRVTEQATGELSKEITRALEEIRMGKSREEALRGIVRRTGVEDLSTFITSIIQAEQLGTNIASTLRVQAATMRQKRRQRIEQQAMKAPVKMLFPLVFFIFPAIFVVLLGPAVIQIMRVFRDTL